MSNTPCPFHAKHPSSIITTVPIRHTVYAPCPPGTQYMHHAHPTHSIGCTEHSEHRAIFSENESKRSEEKSNWAYRITMGSIAFPLSVSIELGQIILIVKSRISLTSSWNSCEFKMYHVTQEVNKYVINLQVLLSSYHIGEKREQTMSAKKTLKLNA